MIELILSYSNPTSSDLNVKFAVQRLLKEKEELGFLSRPDILNVGGGSSTLPLNLTLLHISYWERSL